MIGARGQVDIDEHCESERDTRSPLPYLRSTRLTQADDALREFAALAAPGANDRDGLIGLMHGLHAHMPYTPGATEVDSSRRRSLRRPRRGVPGPYPCLPGLRAQPGRRRAMCPADLYTEDSGHLASHAWAEAWLGDAWYSFDVTNQLARPERHLKLAVGLDYPGRLPGAWHAPRWWAVSRSCSRECGGVDADATAAIGMARGARFCSSTPLLFGRGAGVKGT